MNSATCFCNGTTVDIEKGFDGKLSTEASGQTGHNLSLPYSDTLNAGGLEVFVNVGASNPITVNIKNGGTTQESFSSGTNFNGWMSSSTYSGAFDEIEITRPNSTPSFFAIRVNGVLLVDKANYGTNGFHLAYDPSASGDRYSQYWDRAVTGTEIFNGSQGLIVGPQETNASNPVLITTWTLPTPITGDYEVKFQVETFGGYGNTGYINGSSIGSIYSGTMTRTGSGQLSSIGITSYAMEGGNALMRLGLVYVKVNGKLLFDHTAVCQDDSGNNNLFRDQGLIVPSSPSIGWTGTVNFSRFYSSATGYSHPKYIFDGDLTTRGQTRQNYGNNIYEFDFSSLDLPACTSLRVNILANNGSGTDYLRFNINNIGQKLLTNTGLWDGWLDLTSSDLSGGGFTLPSTINSLYIDLFQGNSTNQGVRAIEYNGEILIDGSAGDCVTDTPVINYALLEDGTNGRLAQGLAYKSTQNAAGKQIYYEAYLAGTGYFHIHFYDSSGSDAYLRSDGLTSNISLASGTFASFTIDDTVSVVFNGTNEFSYYVNGTFAATYTISNLSSGRFLAVTGSNTTSEHNFGQRPYRFTPPNGYSGLYEERAALAASERLYCALDANLNVTDLQSADPGFTTITSPATVTFPATLPSTETPDAALPTGVSFGSEIEVSNDVGTDTKTLTQVTPT